MPSTSTQTVELPERSAERVEKPAEERFSSPEKQPERRSFTIKLMGNVPF